MNYKVILGEVILDRVLFHHLILVETTSEVVTPMLAIYVLCNNLPGYESGLCSVQDTHSLMFKFYNLF